LFYDVTISRADIYGQLVVKEKMDDITDTALGISAGVGIVLCGLCILATAWRQSKIRAQMKPSRSNDDLSSMLDYAIPTGGRPTAAPSEV
jgi:hypothetical protein